MLNFELYNPTNLIFGKGQIEKIATLIPAGAKILLAYGGGSIFKNGIYDQVKAALKDRTIVEFGGIEPNPHYETLLKAVTVINEQNIDFRGIDQDASFGRQNANLMLQQTKCGKHLCAGTKSVRK